MEEQVKQLLRDIVRARQDSSYLPRSYYGDGAERVLSLVETRLREILGETC